MSSTSEERTERRIRLFPLRCFFSLYSGNNVLANKHVAGQRSGGHNRPLPLRFSSTCPQDVQSHSSFHVFIHCSE